MLMSLAVDFKSPAQDAVTAPSHVVLDIGGMTCAALCDTGGSRTEAGFWRGRGERQSSVRTRRRRSRFHRGDACAATVRMRHWHSRCNTITFVANSFDQT
jgi:hypothetical protein